MNILLAQKPRRDAHLVYFVGPVGRWRSICWRVEIDAEYVDTGLQRRAFGTLCVACRRAWRRLDDRVVALIQSVDELDRRGKR